MTRGVFGNAVVPARGEHGWICICRWHDGRVERSHWISQDGADQMAVETEQETRRGRRRVVCEVRPAEAGEEA